MEIDEVDEVKCDEHKDDNGEEIQGSRLGQLLAVSSFGLSGAERVRAVQDGEEWQHTVANG